MVVGSRRKMALKRSGYHVSFFAFSKYVISQEWLIVLGTGRSPTFKQFRHHGSSTFSFNFGGSMEGKTPP